MSNHLGNVLTVVNDQLFGRDASSTTSATNVWYESKVVSYSDYLPFGAQMTGRTGTSTAYRYGFNGQEKDEAGEFGTLTHYDYGFRIYSPVLGKFLSVDPRTFEYPWQSPYVYHRNSPIASVDYLGGGDPPKTHKNEKGQVLTPNGYGADFAQDWYSVVEGNLVMTNGTDYQVWNSETGVYAYYCTFCFNISLLG
jgi:RHS repeat-associated protein